MASHNASASQKAVAPGNPPHLDWLLRAACYRYQSIYVLKLDGGYHYVGKTGKPVEERINQHFNNKSLSYGKQSSWITAHPYRSTVSSKDWRNDFDEDLYTKMYMSIMGIDNVRGGSYSSTDISVHMREYLEQSLPGPGKFKSVQAFEKQKCTVCCLLLENGKYLIAQLDKNETVDSFISRNSSMEWLDVHPLVSVAGVRYDCTCLEVDKYVVMTMCWLSSHNRNASIDEIVDHGISRVRGGSFSSYSLTANQKQVLKELIATAKDACYNCHEIGHCRRVCPSPPAPAYVSPSPSPSSSPPPTPLACETKYVVPADSMPGVNKPGTQKKWVPRDSVKEC